MYDSKRQADEKRHLAQARDAAAKVRRLREMARATEGSDDERPGDEAQDRAHSWVRMGVSRLAKATRREHVVLMAATEPDSGRVGVASSLQCEALVAMAALGELVAEVNRALGRDGVAARIYLRMTEIKPAHDPRQELGLR